MTILAIVSGILSLLTSLSLIAICIIIVIRISRDNAKRKRR